MTNLKLYNLHRARRRVRILQNGDASKFKLTDSIWNLEDLIRAEYKRRGK